MLFREPHFDAATDHPHRVRLQLHLRRGQAFAARQIVLKVVMRAGEDSVLDLAAIEPETHMCARILITGHDGVLPRQHDSLAAEFHREYAALGDVRQRSREQPAPFGAERKRD